MEKNLKRKALVYCRVSSTKQEEKGTSLESQAAACIEYAKTNGYEVAEVVKEVYSGAYLLDRPKLNEQREKIKQGIYDAVIVYDIDRLSRNVAHFSIISDEIERYGAKLSFVNSEFENSPEGVLMMSVKSYVAEVERLKIKERTIRGKKTKVLSGKLVRASTPLYGYDFDDINKVRIINEKEAVIVRRIFGMLLDGTGIRGIIKRLNDENIPSPGTGKRNYKSTQFTNLARHGRTLWNRGAVDRILKEPAYSGHTIAWRYKGESGYEKGKRYYRVGKRDESEWIQMPEGVTPAIVTPETFKSAQKKLATNKGEATRNEIRPELLRGMVFCSDCGARMRPETEVKRLKGCERKIFRCPSRHTVKCDGKAINATKCETAVWTQICEIINNPQTVKIELERQRVNGDETRLQLENEIFHASERMKSIDSEISRLYDRAGDSDDEKWKRFEKIIENKEKELKSAKEMLAQAEGRRESIKVKAEGWRAFLNYRLRVTTNLASFGFGEKRLTLETFNVKITGSGKDIRLDVSLPSIFEKQVNVTNNASRWFTRIGKDNVSETSSNDFAAARI